MSFKSDPSNLTFRPAGQHDAAHLVLFAEMATRRLTSHLWGHIAAPGQSSLEIGRNIIRNDEPHFTHFRNWRVAEDGGNVVGALNGYSIVESTSPSAPVPKAAVPLNELKALAIGTWYLSAIAVYPEHQGNGHGKALLMEAQSLAQAAGMNHLTLMVGSFNAKAFTLYQDFGFRERNRRPFITFPGSDEHGAWILMIKDLA